MILYFNLATLVVLTVGILYYWGLVWWSHILKKRLPILIEKERQWQKRLREMDKEWEMKHLKPEYLRNKYKGEK